MDYCHDNEEENIPYGMVFLLQSNHNLGRADCFIKHLLKRKKVCTDLENKRMVTRGTVGGSDSYGVWEGHVQAAMFKMITNKGLW